MTWDFRYFRGTQGKKEEEKKSEATVFIMTSPIPAFWTLSESSTTSLAPFLSNNSTQPVWLFIFAHWSGVPCALLLFPLISAPWSSNRRIQFAFSFFFTFWRSFFCVGQSSSMFASVRKKGLFLHSRDKNDTSQTHRMFASSRAQVVVSPPKKVRSFVVVSFGFGRLLRSDNTTTAAGVRWMGFFFFPVCCSRFAIVYHHHLLSSSSVRDREKLYPF